LFTKIKKNTDSKNQILPGFIAFPKIALNSKFKNNLTIFNICVLRLFTTNKEEAGIKTKKSMEDIQFKFKKKIEEGSNEENKEEVIAKLLLYGQSLSG